jgi:hypothetical protein
MARAFDPIIIFIFIFVFHFFLKEVGGACIYMNYLTDVCD